jgi:hypothetical protein
MPREPATRRCRRCLSAEVVPARYHGLEFLAALLLLRPFRCRRCLRRFLGFALPLDW